MPLRTAALPPLFTCQKLAKIERATTPSNIREFMATNKKSSRRPTTPGSRHVRNIASKYRLRLRLSPNKKVELFRLKITTPPSDLFEIIPQVFQNTKYYELLYGPDFPSSASEIWTKPFLYQPANHLQEMIWSICRCLANSKKLAEFNALREQYELAIILDKPEECRTTLAKIENEFGHSLWLIQAKLTTARHWGDLAELTKQTETCLTGIKSTDVVRTLIWFIRRRIEATSDNQYLKSELSKALSQTANTDAHTYFETKLFELQDVDGKTISSTLLIEAQTSLIDLYDTLVLILQSVASMTSLPDEVADALRQPVSTLYAHTADSRLRAVLLAIGGSIQYCENSLGKRSAAIEAYTVGDYARCAELAAAHLAEVPQDMSIFLLLHKACVHQNIAPPQYVGILATLSQNLMSLLQLSDGAYVAAHEMIRLSGRFYGISWMTYLRAATLYELRQERATFPPLWMRDMYVRDLGLSPFSAVISRGNLRKQLLLRKDFAESFPTTIAAYFAVTEGKVETGSSQLKRHTKYLARYQLSFGDPAIALAHYSNLLTTSRGADAIRCAGGLALAYIRLDEIENAATTVVDAYLKNPAVPGSLPISDVTSNLGAPATWPKSIVIPILLALHLDYVGQDKLADLRFAFERFQLENNIRTPEELFSLAIDSKYLVTYLNRVWRPEVMRQTILFDSSRQVEESRIKVCQTLAEHDKKNEKQYLEEIKERVKRLAIAKGIKLVEQSKVYVDIQAIKKEVIKRLDSPYKRYKASYGSNTSDKGLVVEKVAEVLSQSIPAEQLSKALSGIHFLGGDSTEGDAQFDAMYAEVTNEFLRGAHGLNAYLSTRIRHGVLSNFLRKPVEDGRLVTSREENKASYVKNDFWSINDKCVDHHAQSAILQSALIDFSRNFDAILDDLRDNLLQIRIDNNIVVGGKESALFVYGSSNVERLFLKAQDRHGKDLDQFVDRCVDHLWSKTDENLTRVQERLSGQIRQNLMSLFDDLASKVTGLSQFDLTSNLTNAISRAKTETQGRLITVVSWFKRGEVYDRQDYTADFLVEVAHNMIKNTISSAANWESVQVEVEQHSELMPGRTLDGMVYAFYGLLENAIKRSRIDINKLTVKCTLSVCNGCFKAIISNNVDIEKITEADHLKISSARTAIAGQESTRLAQDDVLSGLHKIWLAANGPFYSSPLLEFGIEGNQFVVRLQFNMERNSHENLNN